MVQKACITWVPTFAHLGEQVSVADLEALRIGSVDRLTMPHKFDCHVVGYWCVAELCQQRLNWSTPPQACKWDHLSALVMVHSKPQCKPKPCFLQMSTPYASTCGGAGTAASTAELGAAFGHCGAIGCLGGPTLNSLTLSCCQHCAASGCSWSRRRMWLP